MICGNDVVLLFGVARHLWLSVQKIIYLFEIVQLEKEKNNERTLKLFINLKINYAHDVYF